MRLILRDFRVEQELEGSWDDEEAGESAKHSIADIVLQNGDDLNLSL